MTTRKANKVSASLCKKGFVRSETHHTYYKLVIDGRKTNICTFISHGSNEISDHLIRQMSEQLKVNKNEFLKFVDCHMTQEEYVNILKSGNKVIIKSS